MDPIPVPAPPKSAFNKNRRVSDLLEHQLKHFQHVAHKQGINLDPALERDIYTEGGAARYITSITRAVRSAGAKQPQPVPRLVPRAAPEKSTFGQPAEPVPSKAVKPKSRPKKASPKS